MTQARQLTPEQVQQQVSRIPASAVRPFDADQVGITGNPSQQQSSTPLLVGESARSAQLMPQVSSVTTVSPIQINQQSQQPQQTQQPQQPAQIPQFFPSNPLANYRQPVPQVTQPVVPQPANQVTQTTPAPVQTQIQAQPELNDPEAWVSQTFGMNAAQLRDFVTTMQTMVPVMQQVQQQQTNQALTDLRNVWQVDDAGLNFRLNIVQQFLNTLDPVSRNAYEQAGIHGAQLLWQQAVAANPTITQYAPVMESSSSNSNYSVNGQNAIPVSQIIDMPEDEYIRRQPELVAAFNNGFILEDV